MKHLLYCAADEDAVTSFKVECIDDDNNGLPYNFHFARRGDVSIEMPSKCLWVYTVPPRNIQERLSSFCIGLVRSPDPYGGRSGTVELVATSCTFVALSSSEATVLLYAQRMASTTAFLDIFVG